MLHKSSLLIYRYSFPLVGCTQIFNIEMKQKDINEDVVFWNGSQRQQSEWLPTHHVSLDHLRPDVSIRRKSPTIMLHFLVPQTADPCLPPDVPNIFLFSSSCLLIISYSDNITMLYACVAQLLVHGWWVDDVSTSSKSSILVWSIFVFFSLSATIQLCY